MKRFSFGKIFSLGKRQQFVAVTIILTILLVATQLMAETLRFDIMLFLGIVTYILAAIVLKEELSGWEFVTLLILPSFFTAAVFLFYFLLPARWIIRAPIALLYAVGMYAILLTENIYNVAAERTIQLVRAAHTIGLILTLTTLFFLIDMVLSLRLPFYANFGLSLLIVFPLTLQALWSMELTSRISSLVLLGTLVISFIFGQFVLVFSFWPIRTTIASLFLTTAFYSLVGMTQQYIIGRLFIKTTREFLVVFFAVLFLLLLTTRWGGGI